MTSASFISFVLLNKLICITGVNKVFRKETSHLHSVCVSVCVCVITDITGSKETGSFNVEKTLLYNHFTAVFGRGACLVFRITSVKFVQNLIL